MNRTKIEWTAGDDVCQGATWSPVSGCKKVSKGCRHCYAERLWPRLAAPGQPYEGRQFTDVQCHPERLEQPLHWRNPQRIFVNSMSDLFQDSVSDEFIDRVFAVMACAQWHEFQVLTKRPKRMLRYLTEHARCGNNVWQAGQKIKMPRRMYKPDPTWPLPNVWLGVSAENQETADERIPLLLQTPASVRFVSAEPLLGPIDLTGVLDGRLGWVIVGTESGPKARPYRVDWILSILEQCNEAGVSVFLKQVTDLGRKIPYEILPPVMQVRQWPNVNRHMEMLG